MRSTYINDRFLRTRLRLTLFFTGVTMSILLVFSVLLFVSLEQNLKDIIESKVFLSHKEQQALFEQNVFDIEKNIIGIDSALLVAVFALGFFVSGKMLMPIRRQMESEQRFLSNTSHDLRTPLTIMKSEMQVFLESGSTEYMESKKVIESMMEEVNSMSKMVDDILIVARGGEGVKENMFVPVDISSLVDRLVKRFDANAKNQECSIRCSLLEDGVMVSGEPHHLERAFQNIMINAINYNTKQGTVDVKVFCKDGRAHVVVTDTGIGISEEDLPLVFDRFYKASHSRNDSSGSGLGLHIAKQIISHHRGDIYIKSILGVGTEVSIVLPAI